MQLLPVQASANCYIYARNNATKIINNLKMTIQLNSHHSGAKTTIPELQTTA